MSNTPTRADYEKNCERYRSLAINLKESLKTLLIEQDINHLDIQFRIKAFEAFEGKVEKKDYVSPMNDVEDICGLRILCYYHSDLEKISSIIEKEFDVVNSIDKEEELGADQFGYRSKHYVVTVKEQWMNIPNYRGLKELKAEIQIRTILMHAWAEIEHKLQYKTSIDVPRPFKRKLGRLSALFEIADDQFEQVRKERRQYIEKVTPKVGQEFDLDQEMNVDTLQAFLNVYMSDRKKASSDTTSNLLQELDEAKLSFKDIVESYNKAKPFLARASQLSRGISNDDWAQIGAVRVSLRLTNDTYWNQENGKYPGRAGKFLESFEKLRTEVKSKVE